MTMMPLLKGHPVSLAVLDYGLFRVNSNGRVIGICGYLVRTSVDEHVLIDTGFPSKYTEDFRAASDEDRLYEFGEVLVCGPETCPLPSLRAVMLCRRRSIWWFRRTLISTIFAA